LEEKIMKNSKTTLLAIIAGGAVAGISAVAGIFSERKNNARKEAEAKFDEIDDDELKELVSEEEPEPTFTVDTPDDNEEEE
jgi:hypothetical protein